MRMIIEPGAKDAHTSVAARHLLGKLNDSLSLVFSQAHVFSGSHAW